MKTKLTALLVFILFICFNSYSQEHMIFKGISMGLMHSEFASKLKKSGFVLDYKYTGNENIFFTGEFINKQAGIAVMNDKHNIYAVIVNFKSTNQWSELKRLYLSTKELYMTKYGQFSKCVEQFDDSYSEVDGNEMSALFLGYCNYRTTWNLKSGKIILAIMKDEALGRVSIVYYDKINYTIFEKKQKIRARDDI